MSLLAEPSVIESLLEQRRARQRQLRIGEVVVAKPGEELVIQGLGSCVALVLRDRQSGLGGAAHVLLPSAPSDAEAERRPGKFVDSALRQLVAELVTRGASLPRIGATLVGGASMFSSCEGGSDGVGARNVAAARRALAQLGLPLEAEDVGGSRGRSVRVEPRGGRVHVRTMLGEHSL